MVSVDGTLLGEGEPENNASNKKNDNGEVAFNSSFSLPTSTGTVRTEEELAEKHSKTSKPKNNRTKPQAQNVQNLNEEINIFDFMFCYITVE